MVAGEQQQKDGRRRCWFRTSEEAGNQSIAGSRSLAPPLGSETHRQSPPAAASTLVDRACSEQDGVLVPVVLVEGKQGGERENECCLSSSFTIQPSCTSLICIVLRTGTRRTEPHGRTTVAPASNSEGQRRHRLSALLGAATRRHRHVNTGVEPHWRLPLRVTDTVGEKSGWRS